MTLEFVRNSFIRLTKCLILTWKVSSQLSCGFEVNSSSSFMHINLRLILPSLLCCMNNNPTQFWLSSFRVKFCDRKTTWRKIRTGSYSHLIKNTTHVLTFGFDITCVIIFTSMHSVWSFQETLFAFFLSPHLIFKHLSVD